MGERLTNVQLTEEARKLIANFKLGDRLEYDGYEDLGRTLQWDALDGINRLNKHERIEVFKIIFQAEQ